MKAIVTVIIAIICIFGTFGLTYYYVSATKDQEMREFENEIHDWYVETSAWIGSELANITEQLKNMNETLENWKFVGHWTGIKINNSNDSSYEATYQYEFLPNGTYECYASINDSSGTSSTSFDGAYSIQMGAKVYTDTGSYYMNNSLLLTRTGSELIWRIYE